MTLNNALEAAVLALIVVTAALGTSVALRALPAEMPADVRRLATWCSAALATGLGSVLIVGVLVQSAGLDRSRTFALEAVLALTLAAMVAEHAEAARRLRLRWLCTPGSTIPPPVRPPRPLASLPLQAVLGGFGVICAAVLLVAAATDPDLPAWTVLIGIASGLEGLAILGLSQARRLARRPAR